jgi:holo-[acyl-carrier protein] synthase
MVTMESTEQLRNIVAQLAGLPPSDISAAFSLKSRGLQSSVRRAALAAAIRRQIGRTLPEAYSASTFAELAAALNGTSVAEPTATVTKPVMPQPSSFPQMDGLACGIDIEAVDALPEASDYWEHEFYKQNFAKDEIAYCVLQENPRMHFAARWCAKEALIKCDPSLKGQLLAALELVREPSGEVAFAYRANGTSQKLPVAVSISHTDATAIAMVVRRQS